jgi:hypothetical protein
MEGIFGLLGDSEGGKASNAGGGKGKGKRPTNGAEKAHRRAIIQMDARLRAVEAVSFSTVKVRTDFPPVRACATVLQKYRDATTLDKFNHGLGSPTPLLMTAFITSLVHVPLTEAQKTDPAMAAKWSALFLLAEVMSSSDSQSIEQYVEHFHTWDLPAGSHSMLQFCVKGTVTLPSPENLGVIRDAAVQVGQARRTAALSLAPACFSTDMTGVPTAAGVKPTPIQNVLQSFLCGLGGTKESKAPRGGAVAAVKGGKGKGKSWDDEEM